MKDKTALDASVKKRRSNTRKYIRLYVIPIFAATFFIGILIFLTIPKINEIFASIDTISANNAKILENNNKLATLDSLTAQYNTLVDNLSIIDGIAPLGSTEVVKFRDRISDLITSNNLEIISQRLSEANAESDNQDQTTVSPIILQEVPFIFSVKGSYSDIVKFIQSLNTVEDFIVIKEMDLGIDNSGGWRLNINIVKYQFSALNSSNLRDLFVNVPVDAKLNSLIQKYIRARSASTTTTTPDKGIDTSTGKPFEN